MQPISALPAFWITTQLSATQSRFVVMEAPKCLDSLVDSRCLLSKLQHTSIPYICEDGIKT